VEQHGSLIVLKKLFIVGERNMIATATAGVKLEHSFHSAIETYYASNARR
jgi:hypothetical protein